MEKRNLRNSYEEYKLTDEAVDLKTYLTITADYNKFLIEKVLEGHIVTLPSRLGTLCITGRRQNLKIDEEGNITGLAPDWVKTKELWKRDPEAAAQKKRIFHLNRETDNYRYKFLWSKVKVIVENKTLYALRMTRANKRAVHNKIKNGVQYITK